MANKFAKSLQMMEENTNLDHQGVLRGISDNSVSTTSPETSKVREPEATLKAKVIPEIGRPQSTTPANNQASSEARTGSFDLCGMIESLEQRNPRGETVSLYLKREVADQLTIISKERNISKSRLINALLEKALLNK